LGSSLWTLVAWAVFAIGAGIMFGRLTTLLRRHLLGIPSRSERFRQSLERIWQKDQQAA
jgi:cytochrome c biogenesis protein CcdA